MGTPLTPRQVERLVAVLRAHDVASWPHWRDPRAEHTEMRLTWRDGDVTRHYQQGSACQFTPLGDLWEAWATVAGGYLVVRDKLPE